MPEVVFTEPAPALRPKVAIVTEAGQAVELTWVPEATTLDGISAVWARLGRPGLKPLTQPTGKGALSLSLTAILGSADRQTSIDPQLALLRAVAASGARVRVPYGGLEAGWWRISALAVTSSVRAEGSNAVTRATVALTFIEDVPGGPPVRARSIYRYHQWAAGDTMQALAYRYLGSTARWTDIMRFNNLTSTAVSVGIVLRIPPR
jgi:hypothetical protein